MNKGIEFFKLKETLKEILKNIIAYGDYINAALFLKDKNEDFLLFLPYYGIPLFSNITQKAGGIDELKEKAFKFPLTEEKNIAVKIFKSGKLDYTENLFDFIRPIGDKTVVQEVQKLLEIKYILGVPVKNKEKAIGVLIVATKEKEIAKKEIKILSFFANQTALAIENALLNDEIKEKNLYLEEDKIKIEQEAEKIRESEKKYHGLYNTINDGIIMTDMGGHILECNQAYLDILGYTKEEIKKLTYQQIAPLKWLEMEADIFKNQIVARGYCDEYEKECIKKDGTIFPITVRRWLIEDEKRQPVGMWSLIRDITEFKRLQEKEKEVAVAQERAAVIDVMPDALIVSNLDGEVTYINPAYVKMFGRKSADEISRADFKGFKEGLYDPEKDLPRFLGLFKEIIEKGFIEEPIEVRLRRVDGKEFFASVSGSLLRDDKGNPKNVVAVLRDITELKRAEEKLKGSEEHYKVFAAYQRAISELREFYIVDATFEQMVQKTLDLIVKKFGFYMAWYAELIEKEKIILPKLWAGKYEKYLDGLRLEYDSDKKDAKCAMSLAILTKKPFGYADLEHDKDFEKWRAFALQYGYRSNQAIPLIVNGKCKSAFLIYSTRPLAFSEKLVEYLKGVIDELATIIQNITELKRAEEKRAKVMKIASDTIEGMIDVVGISDIAGRITQINTEVESWGYKKEELIGKPVVEVLAKRSLPKLEEERKKTLETGVMINLELIGLKKDGSEFPVIANVTLMKDTEGKPTGRIFSLRDITELKRAEEERARVEGITKIVDAMVDAVVVLDFEGNAVSISRAYADMFGYDPKDLVGKNIMEMPGIEHIKPEDVARFIPLIKEAMKKGSSGPVEFVFPSKEGKEIPVSVAGGVIRDAQGNPTHIVAVLRDITELKRVQDEIVVAKDYTENIIKSMIDTLIVVNPDAKIKTINKATSDLLGYKEDDLIGKTVATIFAEEEEEEEEEEVSIFKGTRLKKLIEEGAVRDYDMKYRTKNGEVIPVGFSGSVMRDKEGEIVGIVGIARDMREIKRLMQKEKELAAAAAAAADAEKKKAAELEEAYNELRTTQEKLVQSEKLATVGRLGAGVAHEINNPLTSALLGVQRVYGMIKKQATSISDSQVYLRNLERVEVSVNRCKRIVAGLLAFSRQPKLQLAPIDINEVVEETLEFLEDQVKARDVRVVKDFAAHLPTIKADRHQLSQVFSNLIINACEAMSKGGQLGITTKLQEPGAEALRGAMGEVDKTVEIEFSDTGKGISKEDLLMIFDPFFTTKETGEKVGLGLSISYGIIEQHRGTIEVSSKKGKGSTFIVSLPAKI